MSDTKKAKKPLSATKRQEPPTEFEPKLTAENVLITRLETQLSEAKSRSFVFEDIIKSLAQAQQDLEHCKDANNKLQTVMNDQNTQIEADHRAFQDERQMWLDEAKALKDNLAVHTQQMQYQLDTKTNEIMRLEQLNRDKDSQLGNKDRAIELLQAQLTVLANSEQSLVQAQGQNHGLLKEITAQQDYLAELEDKLYKANVTSLELLRQLKASESENESLKLYIIDMKQKLAIYIPAKDDQLDAALADYINNYPDRRKLKVMFLRVEPGVYTFGSRKVNLRLELSKLKVRVGGGYISIDEFLDQYTPEELDRQKRHDPLAAKQRV